MGYLNTSTVPKMFPSTKRGNTDKTAREFSEENVTRLPNIVSDSESYVETFGGDPDKNGQVDWNQAQSPIELYIHGYYFKIISSTTFRDEVVALFPNGLKIYACIYLSQSGYIQLQGQDDNGKYQGLSIEADLQNPVQGETVGGLTRYFVLVMERPSTTGTWSVPVQSYSKLDGNSIDFGVDGGYWLCNATTDKTIGSLDINSNVYRG